MDHPALPRLTLDAYARDFAGRHRLHDVVDYWAERKPDSPVVIQFDQKRTLSWSELSAASRRAARRLRSIGFVPGDFLATSLPFTVEHIILEYACFRLGVVLTPLDLRLRPAEVEACLKAVGAKLHVTPESLPDIMQGEERDFADHADPDAGALAIFTTGSTGSPKSALLSHRNITVQNMCLGGAFGFREDIRVLVNLPPSHVGGQTEALMTTLFYGGTAVVLSAFDPVRSLDAIRECRVQLIGQIPAMFQLEWRRPEYAAADLSSLEIVLYGGQQAPVPMLEKMAAMAPRLATGLGLTECAGFCTYTPPGVPPELLAASLGFDMPAYPMTIRREMREDGSAGEELPEGEVGHVCFRGPQTFLGYVNDPDATRRAISSDGWLYTGDLGARGPEGLRLAGRAKWVIKPAGYQVFPGDVERHILQLPQVGACGVVGAEHKTLSEAVVAFVEMKPGATITVQELRRHARGIASYMRPLHYVILEPGQLPLNRSVKTDYVRLAEMARAEVARLRDAGRWDR